jgi:hypothetical protein
VADEDIRIRAELEGALARDVNQAADEVDRLGTQAAETAAQLAVMEAAAAGASRQVGDLDRKSKSAERELRQMSRSSAESAKGHDQATSALDRLHAMVYKFKGKSLDFGKLFSVYKIPAIVTAVTLLATSLSAVGAAAVASAAGLTPMLALSAGLPAGLLAGAQAMGAIKLATSGFGAAVQAILKPGSSPDDIAKAMEGLTPAAARAAMVIQQLATGPLRRLREGTASAFFPGFTRGLIQSTSLLPILSRNLTDTAGVMGRLAAEAGAATNTPIFQQQLGRIMASNNTAILNTGRAGGNLALALLHIVDAFRPVLTSMSEYALRGSRFVEATTQMGNETGRMAQFFDRAWRLARQTGTVIGDLAVGLFNVGRASGEMSDHLGASIERGARAFRDWSGSIAGQASLANWFHDAIPVVDAFLRLIGHLGAAFADLASNRALVPVIDQLTNQLLPAVVQLATTTSTSFGPAIVQAATAFVQFQNALSFTPLAAVLMGVAKAAQVIVGAFTLLPSPIRTAIAVILALNIALRVMGIGAAAGGRAFAPLIQGVQGFRGTGAAATGEMSRMGRAGAGLAGALGTVRHSMDLYSYSTANAADSTRASWTRLQGSALVAGRLRGAFAGLGTVGARAMSGLGRAASGLSGALGGPWGIAIMGATVLLGAFAQKHQQTKAAIDGMSGALNQQNGALTRNAREMAVTNLQQQHAYDYADQLHLSYGTVTQAALGNAGAMREVKAATEAAAGSSRQYYTQGGGLVTINGEAASSGKALIGVLTNQSGVLAESRQRVRQHAAAMEDLNGSQRRAGRSFQASDRAEAALAHAHATTAARARGQTTATNGLTAAQNRLKAATTANVGGWIGFRQAIADANKAITRGSHAMNLHTQAGRDNQTQMVGVANAALAVRGGAVRQADAISEAYKKIVAWARGAGYGKGQAQAYAGALLNLKQKADAVPRDIKPKVQMSGADAAIRDAQRVRQAMTGIPDAFPRIQVLGALVAANQAANVRQQLNDIRNNRFAGGPVETGTRYTVGELGPELYRDVMGRIEVVGAHGQEQRTFPTRGEILPNPVYEAAVAEVTMPAGFMDAIDARTGSSLPRPVAPTAGAGPFVPGPPVQFIVQPQTAFDTEQAIRNAYAKIVADEESRRINHGQG